MKKVYLTLLSILLVQGVALAESISGTVTNVDPEDKKVTLVRSDNNEEVNVSVEDEASLQAVQIGSTVTLDANRGIFGGWKAETVQAGAPASSGDTTDAADTTTAADSTADTAATDTGTAAATATDTAPADTTASTDTSAPASTY